MNRSKFEIKITSQNAYHVTGVSPAGEWSAVLPLSGKQISYIFPRGIPTAERVAVRRFLSKRLTQ